MKTVITDCRREFAKLYAKQQLQQPQQRREAFEYAQKLELGDELTGDSADFHNYASELARADYYEAACEVLRQGTLIYQKNTDLLADYILFAHKCGKQDVAREKFAQLYGIERIDWTWRSFVFSIDYQIELLSGQSGDKRRGVEGTIESLIADFKATLPNEEKAYLAEADYLEAQGKRNDAIGVLKRVIDAGVVRVCPQCCLRFIDRSLENGDYDSVVEYAKKGISMAEEQESVETTAYWYFWALAADHKWYNDNLSVDEPDKASARRVIRLYLTALQLNPNQRYEANCKKRIKMICAYSGIEVPKEVLEPEIDMSQVARLIKEVQD